MKKILGKMMKMEINNKTIGRIITSAVISMIVALIIIIFFVLPSERCMVAGSIIFCIFLLILIVTLNEDSN